MRRPVLIAGAAAVIVAAAVVLVLFGRGRDDDRFVRAPAAQPVRPGMNRGLLIVRDQGLLVRDMATGQEYEVRPTPEEGLYLNHPRWSPDGSRVAYVITRQYTGFPNQDWGSDVAVSGADGSNEQIVFRHPQAGTTVEGIAWSADGATLYLGVIDTRIENGRFVSQTATVQRLDLAGGGRATVAEKALYPTAAFDGSLIAYVDVSGGDRSGLYVARPDGSDPRLILPLSNTVLDIIAPQFSHDSRRIAFGMPTLRGGGATPPSPAARRWPWQPRPAVGHGLPRDIWVIGVEGGEPKRATNLAQEDLAVAWSPDDQEFALLGPRGLFVQRVEGGEARMVAQGALEAQIDWR